jgi:aspartate/methionine/tyrosine aminotransferase
VAKSLFCAHSSFSEALVVADLFWIKLLIRTGIARLLPSVRRRLQGGETFLHYFSDALLSTPYGELTHAARFLELSAPDGIDLARGSPRLDLLPSANPRLAADCRGYPPMWGLPPLRDAIAHYLWTTHRLSARPRDEILVTPGAAGALSAAVDAFVNAGDRVALFDPGPQLYPLLLRQRRARLNWVATWMEEGKARFRLEDLAGALRGAKMIVLASPNNPTGAIWRPEDFEALIWWCRRRDVLIFHDAVLAHYQYEGEPSCIAQLPGAAARTLTAGSLSKSHGLAWARMGWLAGNRHLVGACGVTAALHASVVSAWSQQLALLALQLDASVLTATRADFASRRQYAFDRLQAMGLQPAWPGGGFFFWVPVRHLGLTGGQCAERLLQEHNILVWPGSFFGPSGRDHIRLSYALEEGRLTEGLRRLTEFLRPDQRQSGIAPPHHRLFAKNRSSNPSPVASR